MAFGRWVVWAMVVLVAGCAYYRPGVDGSVAKLPQNATANSEPQPAGSMPR